MYHHAHRRLKIVLLALGVMLGYGSALAHFAWHRGHPGWHHACEDMPWNAPAPQGGATKPDAAR